MTARRIDRAASSSAIRIRSCTSRCPTRTGRCSDSRSSGEARATGSGRGQTGHAEDRRSRHRYGESLANRQRLHGALLTLFAANRTDSGGVRPEKACEVKRLTRARARVLAVMAACLPRRPAQPPAQAADEAAALQSPGKRGLRSTSRATGCRSSRKTGASAWSRHQRATTAASPHPEGRSVADAWDAAKDEAAGDQCKAYGAGGVMRLPGFLHITWENEQHAAHRCRPRVRRPARFYFGAARPPAGGTVVARLLRGAMGIGGGGTGQPRTGNLKVVTTRMKAGYLRRNGVPYSANAVLTEWYESRHHAGQWHVAERDNGSQRS